VDHRPNHYHRYRERTERLRAAADRYPDLLDLRSIGTSPKSRAVWDAALTDTATGAAETKPTYWIDGNTRASEPMGSAAARFTIDWVLRRADEPDIAELLRATALYVAPRVNHDGAEGCLETGRFVRSAPRLYPDRRPRFVEADVDGDGEVLQMRIRNPDRTRKVSDEDSRRSVPRRPWDREGRFDPEALRDPQYPVGGERFGLDFNRRGSLPTAVARPERGAPMVRDLRIEVDFTGGPDLVDGDRQRQVGHLDGRADVTRLHASAFTWRGETRGDRHELDRVVRGSGRLTLRCSGDRIGPFEDSIRLQI